MLLTMEDLAECLTPGRAYCPCEGEQHFQSAEYAPTRSYSLLHSRNGDGELPCLIHR